LIITPDNIALTGDGAAGCASGSQNWPNGHMPIFMPNPTRNKANASAVVPGLVANSNGRFPLTVSKSYFRLAPPRAAAPVTASNSAPIMVAAQAICIIIRNLFAARMFSGFRFSKRMSA
jgi:hypothetical protein